MSSSAAGPSSSAHDPDYEFDTAWVQAEPEHAPQQEQQVQQQEPPVASPQRGGRGNSTVWGQRGSPLRTPPGFSVRQPTVPGPNGGESSRAGAARGFQQQQQQTPVRQGSTAGQQRGGRGNGAARPGRTAFSENISSVPPAPTATTATTGTTSRGGPGRFMVPRGGYQRSAAWVNNVYVAESPQDEYGTEGFVRPNVLPQGEEDEDYDEHPTGFRRANEADLAERSGQPPDSMALPLSVDVVEGGG